MTQQNSFTERAAGIIADLDALAEDLPAARDGAGGTDKAHFRSAATNIHAAIDKLERARLRFSLLGVEGCDN